MKNIEVARAIVGNALAYADSGTARIKAITSANHADETIVFEAGFTVDCLKANLELLEKLLERPDSENREFTWNDFK